MGPFFVWKLVDVSSPYRATVYTVALEAFRDWSTSNGAAWVVTEDVEPSRTASTTEILPMALVNPEGIWDALQISSDA